MDLLNDFNLICSGMGRSLSGVIVIVLVDDAERRRMIFVCQHLVYTAQVPLTSVANLVHRFSLRGKGISVMASSTELFPDDWSPQTTS